MTPEHTDFDLRKPLEINRKLFIGFLAAVWLAIITTQAVVFVRSQISVRDACGVYLPMARAAADGDWRNAQSVKYPPLYSMVTGLVSRALPFADYPEELAGKLVNVVCMHAILACVLVICLKLFSPRVAVVAVGLVGLNPQLLVMSVNVWLEPMYATVLTISAMLLVLTRDRLRWWAVVLLGACSGAAPLIRGEGLLLPFCIVAAMVVMHFRRSWPAAGRLAAQLILFCAVVAAVWMPRINYVHDQTGLWLLDVRAASLIGQEDKVPPDLWWSTPLTVDDPGKTLTSIPQVSWRRPNDSLGEWLQNNLISLYEAWNPLVLILGLFTVFRRRPLQRYGRVEIALGMIIAMQLLSTAFAHDWQRRYVAVVAPIAAVFGAVGMVVTAEIVRYATLKKNRVNLLNSWSLSIARQLILISLLFALCAGFCIRRAQTRRSDIGEAGRYIAAEFGPGMRIMARTPESAYYGRGRLIPVPEWRTRKLSNAELLAAMKESRADLFLLDVRHLDENSEHIWCPEFYESLKRGAYGKAEVALPADIKDTLRLFDAGRLIEELSSAAASDPAGQSG